jgi:hypothetical protein
LTQLGHEVIVAHARNVRLIGESSRKDVGWMREHWHGWQESILKYWGRCAIAVLKRKFI